MSAVLDTHTAIWYLLEAPNLPEKIFTFIDDAATRGTPTYISAVSLVEIVYLVERGRIAGHAFDSFLHELRSSRPAFKVVPLDSAITEVLRTIPRSEVPDMPDRIIAATALYLGIPLITRDRRLQSAGIQTLW